MQRVAIQHCPRCPKHGDRVNEGAYIVLVALRLAGPAPVGNLEEPAGWIGLERYFRGPRRIAVAAQDIAGDVRSGLC